MERAGAPQAVKTREWAAALAAALPEMKVIVAEDFPLVEIATSKV